MTERQTPRRHDATLHEINRRVFLRLGVAAGAGTLAAACGRDGGRAIRPLLLDWSRVNDWVGEKVFFSPTHLARTYSPAERSAMLPSYFISDMTPMLSDPDRWRLRVQGLVEQPLDLSLDRKSTRLNSSHSQISYAVFCLKKKKKRASARCGQPRLGPPHSPPPDRDLHSTLVG